MILIFYSNSCQASAFHIWISWKQKFWITLALTNDATSLSPFVKIANDKLVYQRDSTESEKELALIGTPNKKNYYKQTNKQFRNTWHITQANVTYIDQMGQVEMKLQFKKRKALLFKNKNTVNNHK